MKLQIFIMIISSLFVSFFVSFVICFILAKVTSMPSRKRSDVENDKLAGALYRANVSNLKKTPKLSTFKVTSHDNENGAKSKSVVIKDFNHS